jgi:NAD(P)-dependent dehydrogenase (short-subunit alcohol dehydrogenase family)
MADLASVRAAADTFLSQQTRLDILIANAGVMALPPGLTSDGYEIQFGINHLANTALLLHLLPLLSQTADSSNGADEDADADADVRFVALTSPGYKAHSASGIDFDSLRTTQEGLQPMGTWTRYAQSKLANILTAHELGRRFPKITSVAVHPGVVKTGLVTELGFWQRLLVYVTNPGGMISARQGCFNTLWAATGRDVRERMAGSKEKRCAVTGLVCAKAGGRAALFEPVGVPNVGDDMCWDEELARKLWEWTEKQVGEFA